MNTNELGALAYEAKLAREALAGARARDTSPLDLAILMDRDSRARMRHARLFFTALKRRGLQPYGQNLDANTLEGDK